MLRTINFKVALVVTLATLTTCQFSLTCRNLLKAECSEFAATFDTFCECDLHPVKATGPGAATSRRMLPQGTTPRPAPGISCMRFSRRQVDRLFSCLAQPNSVQLLDFDKENWKKLPNFGNFTNLRILRLRDLGLPEIDARALSRLSKLEFLELSDNKFSELPLGLLDGVAGLQELILRGNRISKLERRQFAAGTTRLRRLTLSEMNFQSIPQHFFDVFPELEYLEIQKTFLKHVGSLGTLGHLRSLKLDGNRIRSIDLNAFMGLYKLESLDLRHNFGLRSFSGDLLLTQVNHLRELFLGRNIFFCDCKMQSLAKWLRNVVGRQKREIRLDPDIKTCVISPRRHGNVSCGPKCYRRTPSEYFADVDESQLFCTTTSTTTTTQKPTPAPSGSQLVMLNWEDDEVLSRRQPIFYSEESSTEYPAMAFDQFSLVIWISIVAATSLLIVVVVVIVARVAHIRRNKRARYRPPSSKVIALSGPNAPLASMDRSSQSPDSESSQESQSTSQEVSSEGGSHQPERRDPITQATCCYPGRSILVKNSGTLKRHATDYSSSPSQAPLTRGDWSPLFERIPNLHSSKSYMGSPLMMLAVDTKTAPRVSSALMERRRPVSTFTNNEPLVVPTKPSSFSVQHATPIRLPSSMLVGSRTMTLNRQPQQGDQNGITLYPAYKSLSKSSHNTLNTSVLSSTFSSQSPKAKSSTSSNNVNKSESLV